MNGTVLVVVGYGVFGSLLCRGLLRDKRFDVLVAGRDRRAAAAFCALHGGRAVQLDLTAPDFEARVVAEQPFAVIDATGPFQAQTGYAVARAVITAGAHHLDLSDDAVITQGIGTLDDTARAAGVAVLSGVSIVPALSSAAARALAADIAAIHLIETMILPGNRAPRGCRWFRRSPRRRGIPWRNGARGRQPRCQATAADAAYRWPSEVSRRWAIAGSRSSARPIWRCVLHTSMHVRCGSSQGWNCN